MIVEPKPSENFQATSKWLDNITTSTDDMTGLWATLEPKIKTALKYSFSDANPNGWAAISQGWKDDKRQMGRPETIGINTGTMKRAFTDSATMKKGKKEMAWLYNQGLVNRDGDQVGVYAPKFNILRPILKYTKLYINRLLKKATLTFLTKNKTGPSWKGSK